MSSGKGCLSALESLSLPRDLGHKSFQDRLSLLELCYLRSKSEFLRNQRALVTAHVSESGKGGVDHDSSFRAAHDDLIAWIIHSNLLSAPVGQIATVSR